MCYVFYYGYHVTLVFFPLSTVLFSCTTPRESLYLVVGFHKILYIILYLTVGFQYTPHIILYLIVGFHKIHIVLYLTVDFHERKIPTYKPVSYCWFPQNLHINLYPTVGFHKIPHIILCVHMCRVSILQSSCLSIVHLSLHLL